VPSPAAGCRPGPALGEVRPPYEGALTQPADDPAAAAAAATRRYTAGELSSLLYALVKLGAAPAAATAEGQALAQAVLQQLQQRPEQFDPDSLCSTVWALVKTGCRVPGEALECVSARLEQQVRRVAWAPVPAQLLPLLLLEGGLLLQQQQP
jgi:hypothetical protein